MKAPLFFIFFLFIIIASHSQEVDFDWSSRVGSTEYDFGRDIVIDGNGNIYSVGRFSGSIDMDPGLGVNSLTSNGDQDIFVQKLDENRNLIWAKSFGGSSFDEANAVDIDKDDNIYITGGFGSVMTFGEGENEYVFDASCGTEVFIIKLSPEGEVLWAMEHDGGNSNAKDILVTDSHIYITGSFWGTIDFAPGIPTYELTVDDDESGAFVAKYNLFGELIWAKSLTSDEFMYTTAICSDRYQNVYVSGCFEDTVNFEPESDEFIVSTDNFRDIFLLKLNSIGEPQWVHTFGSEYYVQASDVEIVNDSEIVLIGSFRGNTDFGIGSEVDTIELNGDRDGFIYKFDQEGNKIWLKILTNIGSIAPLSICKDNDNNLFLGGVYNTLTDFDLSNEVYACIPNINNFDLFVMKTDADFNFNWIQTLEGTNYISISCNGIAVGINNDIAITGSFSYSTDWLDGYVTSAGYSDIYVVRYVEEESLTSINNTNWSDLNIYPNPTTGILNIENVGYLNLEVYNINGKLLFKTRSRQIDISNYPKGVYIIKVIENNKTQLKRVVKI